MIKLKIYLISGKYKKGFHKHILKEYGKAVINDELIYPYDIVIKSNSFLYNEKFCFKFLNLVKKWDKCGRDAISKHSEKIFHFHPKIKF